MSRRHCSNGEHSRTPGRPCSHRLEATKAKGAYNRNVQPEQRNGLRPVQPRAHQRHLARDSERRGDRPDVRLIELEGLRPCARVEFLCRVRPIGRTARTLAVPLLRVLGSGEPGYVRQSLQRKPQSILTSLPNCRCMRALAAARTPHQRSDDARKTYAQHLDADAVRARTAGQPTGAAPGMPGHEGVRPCQLVRSAQPSGRSPGAVETTESSSVPTCSNSVIFANSGTT